MRLLKSVFILFFTVCSVAYAQMGIHTNGTWEFVGLDSMVVLHLNVNGDTIYAGTWDRNNNLNSGLYYSSDGGTNWARLDSLLGEGVIVGLERNIDNTIYIIKCPCQSGSAGTLQKTTNNGQSWELINNISNNGISWIRISPFNSNEMYAIDVNSFGGGDILNSLFKSTDGGTNWEEIGSFPSDSHGNRLTVALDLLHDSTLYAGVSTDLIGDYFFKSTDKGDNWFFVSTPPTVPGEIYTDYFIPNIIYLIPGPYVSTSGGLNWFVADSGFTENSYYFSFYQDKSKARLLYILLTDGLYASGNDTFYWTRVEGSEFLPLDLPFGIRNLKNITIDEISKRIYLGTSNGIYRKSVVTSVLEEEMLDIEEFILDQNFPNPFNPTTTINYNLLKNAFVTLKVYDLLGNEVAILVNEEKQRGNYKLEFNGSNLSSGVYFYVLTATTETGLQVKEGKKMLLIK